jgi:hypothetical protein
MKLRAFVTLAAVGLVTAGFAVDTAAAAPHVVFAQQKAATEKPKAKPAKKDEAGPAGHITKKLRLAPKGLQFGMSNEAIAKLYDKVYDAEFLPLYKKVQPGVRMQALDAELADKKAALRRSRIDFGALPTGVDQSALKGEYSYGNRESMTRMTLRNGTVRSFFFFEDRLWKVYDEHKLREGGSLGATYEAAIQNLTKKFGAAPKAQAADPKKGRNFDEASWTDGETIVRAINREPILALVYVDKSIQDRLPTLRRNKIADAHAMDKDVASATKKEPTPEELKAKEAAEKEQGKGKKAKPKAKPKAAEAKPKPKPKPEDEGSVY